MWAIRKQPLTPAAAAIGAAVVAAAVTVLYGYVIAGQGDADRSRPRLIGASLVFASFVLLASTLTAKAPARLLLLSLGSFTLLIWMVLGAFSIGVLLLPAALLALFAASRTAQFSGPAMRGRSSRSPQPHPLSARCLSSMPRSSPPL